MSLYWKTYRGHIPIHHCMDGYVTIQDHTYPIVGYADDRILEEAYKLIAPIAERLGSLRCLVRIGIERARPTVWVSGKVNIKITKVDDTHTYLYITQPCLSVLRLETRVLEDGIINNSNLLTVINQLQ